METNYIEPNIYEYKSFDELLKNSEKTSIFTYIDDVDAEAVKIDSFIAKNCFVFGKPGYGKSRLLKELCKRSIEKYEKNVMYIDAKLIRKGFVSNFEEFYKDVKKSNLEKYIIEGVSDEIDIDTFKLYRSSNFDSSFKEDAIIFVDALDEVASNDGKEVINVINELKRKDNVKVIVSCRTTYYQKYRSLLGLDNGTLINIQPLTQIMIAEVFKKYSENQNIDKTKIKEICKRYDALVKVPRYLINIIPFITDLDNMTSKNEIFSLCVDKKFDDQSEKSENKQISHEFIFKRILSKIALIMKIYGKYQISKDELISILEEVDSSMLRYLFSDNLFQIFSDKSLLIDHGENVEFENAEFLEYFAADEIYRLDNNTRNRVLYDLVFNKNLEEIYPNWINVLMFLIDQNEDILFDVIESLNLKSGSLSFTQLLERLNPNTLKGESGEKIVSIIIDYYFCFNRRLSSNASKIIAEFYTIAIEERLKGELSASDENSVKHEIVCFNIINTLIEGIKSQKKMDHKFWEGKYFGVFNIMDNYTKRRIIKYFVLLKKIDYIKKIHVTNIDSNVFREILDGFEEAGGDYQFGLEILREERNFSSMYSYKPVMNVINSATSEKEFKDIIDCMIKKPVILKNIEERYSDILIDLSDYIQEKMEVYKEKEIYYLMNEFVMIPLGNEKSWFSKVTENIFIPIMRILNRNDDYIEIFVGSLNKLGNISSTVKKNHIKRVLSDIVSFNTLQTVKNYYFNNQSEKEFALFLYYFKNADRDDKETYYDYGKEIYPEMYEAFRIEEEKYSTESRVKGAKHDIFFKMLENAEEQNIDKILHYYWSHKEKLNLNDEHEKTLETLVIRVLSERTIDLNQRVLHITKKEDVSSLDSIEDIVDSFMIAIDVGHTIGLGLSSYRKQLVKLIPLVDSERLKSVLNYLKELLPEEYEILQERYSGNRNDDLRVRSQNIIDVCKHNGEFDCKNILEGFVFDEDIPDYVRENALILHREKYLEYCFLDKVFKKIEVESLRDIANGLIISEFKFDKTIGHKEFLEHCKWRISELESRKFEFAGKENFYYVSPDEEELDSMKFAKPIMKLGIKKHYALVERLLESSIRIREGSYIAYSNYLGKIFFEYIDSIFSEISNKDILKFENKVRILIKENNIDTIPVVYLNNIGILKNRYLEYQGKKANVYEAIDSYNRLRKDRHEIVSSDFELFEKLKDIISIDLKNWIELEGAFKFISESTYNQETMIQKVLSNQLSYLLSKYGFKEGIHVFREVETYDGLKLDFVIKYGFVKPVVIEIKRVDNKEIVDEVEREKYESKMNKYLESQNSNYGIYLVFQINHSSTINKYIPKLKNIYDRGSKNIDVIGLNCVGDLEKDEQEKMVLCEKAYSKLSKLDRTTIEKVNSEIDRRIKSRLEDKVITREKIRSLIDTDYSPMTEEWTPSRKNLKLSYNGEVVISSLSQKGKGKVLEIKNRNRTFIDLKDIDFKEFKNILKNTIKELDN